MKPSISIIIVSYNNEKSIRECVSSVFRSFSKNFLDFQIILIDNDSADRTTEIVSEYKKVSEKIKIIENSSNLGFSRAVNQGLELSQEDFRPDFYAILNPDAKIPDGSLIKEMIRRIMTFGAPLIASPKIIKPNEKIWFENGKIKWLKQKAIHAKARKRDFKKIDDFQYIEPAFISGCSMFFPQSVLEKIGLLDESFFLFYEDADFCLRAKEKGVKMAVFLDLKICHIESFSFTNRDFKTYHLVRSGLLFFHKHSPKWLLPLFWSKFYLRYFYHKFLSGKKNVLKAMQDFKS